MIHEQSNSVTLENGPRPAGQPDRCFYCERLVGMEHKPGCVLRTRSVVMRYEYTVVIDVPQDWAMDDIESHRNNSTWCADNSVEDVAAMMRDDGCLCDGFRATYVREATAEDEAKRRDDYDDDPGVIEDEVADPSVN
jgi:hypothetical protein